MQVFMRSFSTKGTQRGLGTYSMKILGEQHLGGTVDFTTSDTEGTTFFIIL
jgi:sensor histidine kinase regulating citrate/malate metabolism